MFRALALFAAFLSACAVTPSKASESAESQSFHIKDGWNLVWSDEFNGTEIDLSKWSHEIDCWGGGNEERQCYTDEPDNSFVENGFLFINALIDPTTGYALTEKLRKTDEEKKATTRKPFSSARLNTKGKADWLYGRFEVRAKMPTGQGMWPAIWMLPTEEHYGGWAASGEIDIVEAVNQGAKCKKCDHGIENRIFGTIHYGREWPHNKYKGEETSLSSTPDGFHTYAVEWKEGEITWFVDGRKYSTLTSKDWMAKTLIGKKKNKAAPFDRPFHIIMNLAVGGHLAEEKNEGGVTLKGYPKSMIVDWVRVYQENNSAK